MSVPPGLRPKKDPSIGDRASAAGPVQRGSHRQAQIHALEFHVERLARIQVAGVTGALVGVALLAGG